VRCFERIYIRDDFIDLAIRELEPRHQIMRRGDAPGKGRAQSEKRMPALDVAKLRSLWVRAIAIAPDRVTPAAVLLCEQFAFLRKCLALGHQITRYTETP
jgi:hypothetical protein